MRTVEFKFDLKVKVKTDLGQDGIVESLCLNRGGEKIYLVRTTTSNEWYSEKDLTLTD